MKISAIAPWFGSKRTLAPEIIRQLGPHSAYWEPFCGSMAVLLAKPRCTFESVNDLHRDLINLALILQNEATAIALYDRAGRTLFHEDMLLLAKEKLLGAWEPGEPDPERAYWYLVQSWMAMNGLAGTVQNGPRCGVAARFSAKGGNSGTCWRAVGESIPYWHERLLGVQILGRDAFEIIPQIDDAAGTVMYVDPPYLVKGAAYKHDFTVADHRRLAELLRTFKRVRVVVSYYDHPLLADLYPGWASVSCSVAKAMVQGGKRDQNGRTEAPEVLLINGPAVPDPAHQFFGQ